MRSAPRCSTRTCPTARPSSWPTACSGFLTESEAKHAPTRITDHFTGGELVSNACSKLTARLTHQYTKSVGIPKGFRGLPFTDSRQIVALNPQLTFVEDETQATIPENKRSAAAPPQRAPADPLAPVSTTASDGVS